jgi:Cytochrome P450
LLQHYGNRFYLQLDIQSVCLFTEKPEDIQRMLKSPNAVRKDDIYQLTSEPGGLMALSGAAWQERREQMEPHFGEKSMEVYLPIFNRHARHLVADVGAMVGHAVDVKEVIGRCTMDTLGGEFSSQFPLQITTNSFIPATLLGKKIDYKEDAQTRTAFERLTSVFEKRRFQIWLQTKWFFCLTKYSQMFNKDLKVVQNLVQTMMTSDSVADGRHPRWIDVVKEQTSSPEEVTAECILTMLLVSP